MTRKLRVEVIEYKGLKPARPLEAVFDRRGGSMGKKADNRLVLPDPTNVISRSHAVIRFDNGNFAITDRSTNGTHICNRQILLRGCSAPLLDGDILKIGDYMLRVTFLSKGDEGSRLAKRIDPSSGLKESVPFLPVQRPSETPDRFVEDEDINRGLPIDQGFIPPQGRFGPSEVERIPTSFHFEDLLKDAFDSPPESCFPLGPDRGEDREPALDEGLIPSRKRAAERSEYGAVPTHDQRSHQRPAGAGDFRKGLHQAHNMSLGNQARATELFDAFLMSAGIGGLKALNEEQRMTMMRNAGAVFKKLVQGFMLILDVRARQKREMKAAVTTVSKGGNNPLKHSAAVEDAILQLISNGHPGFLNGMDAVDEACEDIMSHQMATAAGLQASLETLLQQFAPHSFEQRYREGITLNRKAKCWEAYTRSYSELVKQVMDNLYGLEFLEAYQRQLQRIQEERKHKQPQ